GALDSYGLGARAGARWDWSGDPWSGLYLMPSVASSAVRVATGGTGLGSAINLGVGVEVGRTWRRGDVLFELGSGLLYLGAVYSAGTQDRLSTVVPTVHLGVGYVW
ncbi:MAG: hypothetical protein AAGC55_07265, partial [Myxococcota bacterium]